MSFAIRHCLLPALAVLAATALGALLPAMAEALPSVAGNAAGTVIAIALALALAWLGGRVADLLIDRAAERRGTQSPRLLRDLARGLLFGIAGLFILARILDQPISALLATSGALIAVVSFALRNMLADIASGIALNIEQPYRLGDWIEVGHDTVGRVDEITWRATRLITLQGDAIMIPNGVIANNRFVNHSVPTPEMRCSVHITLDHTVPAERAKRLLQSAALAAEGILPDPLPDVVIESIGADGVAYGVRYWIPHYGKETSCRDAVAQSILAHLNRARIRCAYPKQDTTQTPAIAEDPVALCRDLLAVCEVFAPFDETERERLAAAMRRIELPAGATVVGQAETGRSLFLLAEGLLAVEITKEGGQPFRVGTLRAGEVFGEMSLLMGTPRSASVIAITPVLAFELDHDALEPLLHARPDLADGLARLMARRQRSNDAAGSIQAAATDAHTDAAGFLRRIRAAFGLRVPAAGERV